jgi:hypothetical protein
MATPKKKRPRGRPPGAEKVRVNLKLPVAVDALLYEMAGKKNSTKSAYVVEALEVQFKKDREVEVGDLADPEKYGQFDE